MGNVECAGTIQQPGEKIVEVQIKKVANGFIIHAYRSRWEDKIANTLDEALALVRKEFGE